MSSGPPAKDKTPTQEAKLAQALRDNLRRRKAAPAKSAPQRPRDADDSV